MTHTYYIPAHRKVYGDEKDNLEVVARLYAIYTRYFNQFDQPGRYDGVSIFCDTSETIRVILNHNGGKSTDKASQVFDLSK